MYKHGEIILAEINTQYGKNIIKKQRPCVVVSNNKNNRFASVVTIIPLTSSIKKLNKDIPTHVKYFHEKECVFLVEQISTISIENCVHLENEILDKETMEKLKKAISIQLNIITDTNKKYI